MDEDAQRPAKKYPISIAKLSKTPSWIMLGFVLGALFVIALPPLGEDKPVAPKLAPVEPPKPAAPARPQVTVIQAVFEDPRWEGYAVWSNDTTEVALWNRDAREFSDFFEVRRFGGANYYRSLPSLTRPIIKPRVPLPEDCPLRFTAAVAEEFFRDARAPGRGERRVDLDLYPPPRFGPGQEVKTFSAPEITPPPSIAQPALPDARIVPERTHER